MCHSSSDGAMAMVKEPRLPRLFAFLALWLQGKRRSEPYSLPLLSPDNVSGPNPVSTSPCLLSCGWQCLDAACVCFRCAVWWRVTFSTLSAASREILFLLLHWSSLGNASRCVYGGTVVQQHSICFACRRFQVPPFQTPVKRILWVMRKTFT